MKNDQSYDLFHLLPHIISDIYSFFDIARRAVFTAKHVPQPPHHSHLELSRSTPSESAARISSGTIAPNVAWSCFCVYVLDFLRYGTLTAVVFDCLTVFFDLDVDLERWPLRDLDLFDVDPAAWSSSSPSNFVFQTRPTGHFASWAFGSCNRIERQLWYTHLCSTCTQLGTRRRCL